MEDLTKNSSHRTELSDISPWTIKQPNVIMKLSDLPKTKTHPPHISWKILENHEKYSNHASIFIDDSKDGEKTGCVAVFNQSTFKKRLPMEASIFSAEAYAIHLPLNHIATNKYNKFIIFSDSLSVLLISLKKKKNRKPTYKTPQQDTCHA